MALLIDIKQPDWMTDEQLCESLLSIYPSGDIRCVHSPGNHPPWVHSPCVHYQPTNGHATARCANAEYASRSHTIPIVRLGLDV